MGSGRTDSSCSSRTRRSDGKVLVPIRKRRPPAAGAQEDEEEPMYDTKFVWLTPRQMEEARTQSRRVRSALRLKAYGITTQPAQQCGECHAVVVGMPDRCPLCQATLAHASDAHGSTGPERPPEAQSSAG